MIKCASGAMWAALAFRRQSNTWKVLSVHDDPLQAGRACLRAFLPTWRAIRRQARCLRALIQDPEIAQLMGDSINGPMLMRTASVLSRVIESEGENIVRLLDEPDADDKLDEDLGVDSMYEHRNGFEPDDAFDDQLINYEETERLLQVYRDLYRSLIESDKRAVLHVTMLFPPEISEQGGSFPQELTDALFIGIAKSSILRICQDGGTPVSEAALDEAHQVARDVVRKLGAKEEVAVDPFVSEMTKVIDQSIDGKNQTDESPAIDGKQETERLLQFYSDLYRGLVESDNRFLLLFTMFVRPEIVEQGGSLPQELADALFVGFIRSSVLRLYQIGGTLVSKAVLDEAHLAARDVLHRQATNERVAVASFEAKEPDGQPYEGENQAAADDVAENADRDRSNGEGVSDEDKP